MRGDGKVRGEGGRGRGWWVPEERGKERTSSERVGKGRWRVGVGISVRTGCMFVSLCVLHL